MTGQQCLEAFSGHECKHVNPVSSVVVSGGEATADKLTDLVQLYIDQTLKVSREAPLDLNI